MTIDLADLMLDLEAAAGNEALTSTTKVAVRTQDGETVLLTIGLTDIRVENGIVMLIGDLAEVDS